MRSGRWTLCMTNSLMAEASGYSMSSMTTTERPWAWRSSSRCRLSGLSVPSNRSLSGEAGPWLSAVTMVLRTSAAPYRTGPKRLALPYNASNSANRSKTPTSSASTERCVTNGYPSITGKTSMKSETTQPDGSGPTIMNVQTWPWAASHQNSGWRWPLNVYFRSPLKRGGLPIVKRSLLHYEKINIL